MAAIGSGSNSRYCKRTLPQAGQVGNNASLMFAVSPVSSCAFVLATSSKRRLCGVARLLSPDSSNIPNIKNLYVLLLAETGLLGFWLFIGFNLSILAAARMLLKKETVVLKYIGAAGLFIWLAVAIRNFTQDSLNFPVMWVSLGMLVGYAHHMLKTETKKE